MLGAKNSGAMNGTSMMLKAMGIDPEAIMQNVEAAKVTATQVMQHFDARLSAIEKQLAELTAAVKGINA